MSSLVRNRRARHKEAVELDITAFMNLMVILVPFLLITAVFSRLAILELNLPTANAEPTEQVEPEFQLEVTVRQSGIEIGDRTSGVLNRIAKLDGGYDLAQLSTYLQRVKQQFPDKANATLLLEREVDYQTIVRVMDTIRVVERLNDVGNQVVKYELFPEISIGDAPSSRL